MNYIYTSLTSAAVGGALVWYFMPAPGTKVQVQQQTVTQYEVKTVERIVKQPGGVEIIERTTTDNSVKTDESKSSSVTINRKDWSLGLGIGTKFDGEKPEYQLQVQRRILGNIFAGAYGRTDKEIGLLLSWEF